MGSADADAALDELTRAVDQVFELNLITVFYEGLARLVVGLETQRSGRSAAAWLAYRCRLPIGVARRSTIWVPDSR